jgi:hypothetical protein
MTPKWFELHAAKRNKRTKQGRWANQEVAIALIDYFDVLLEADGSEQGGEK